MMTRFLIAFLILTAFISASHGSEKLALEVIHTEVGLSDDWGQPTLCLVTAREQDSGKLIGLVEDITDCFWTRSARRSPEQVLLIPRQQLDSIEGDLLLHLHSFDAQLEYLYSAIE